MTAVPPEERVHRGGNSSNDSSNDESQQGSRNKERNDNGRRNYGYHQRNEYTEEEIAAFSGDEKYDWEEDDLPVAPFHRVSAAFSKLYKLKTDKKGNLCPKYEKKLNEFDEEDEKWEPPKELKSNITLDEYKNRLGLLWNSGPIIDKETGKPVFAEVKGQKVTVKHKSEFYNEVGVDCMHYMWNYYSKIDEMKKKGEDYSGERPFLHVKCLKNEIEKLEMEDYLKDPKFRLFYKLAAVNIHYKAMTLRAAVGYQQHPALTPYLLLHCSTS